VLFSENNCWVILKWIKARENSKGAAVFGMEVLQSNHIATKKDSKTLSAANTLTSFQNLIQETYFTFTEKEHAKSAFPLLRY